MKRPPLVGGRARRRGARRGVVVTGRIKQDDGAVDREIIIAGGPRLCLSAIPRHFPVKLRRTNEK